MLTAWPRHGWLETPTSSLRKRVKRTHFPLFIIFVYILLTMPKTYLTSIFVYWIALTVLCISKKNVVSPSGTLATPPVQYCTKALPFLVGVIEVFINRTCVFVLKPTLGAVQYCNCTYSITCWLRCCTCSPNTTASKIGGCWNSTSTSLFFFFLGEGGEGWAHFFVFVFVLMEQNLESWPHAVVVMYLLNLQKDFSQVCS